MNMAQKLELFISKYWRESLLLMLSLFLFFAYSYLAIDNQGKFYAPDETANYYIIQQFVETGHLYGLEPLNLEVGNVVLPRSLNISGEKIVPQGFVGLPLIYGSLANVFGLGVVPYLSPIFAILSLWLFYFLVSKYFSRNVALASTFMFGLLPAFWFNVSKLLIPNSLLLFFVLGAWLTLILSHRRGVLLAGLSAWLFGMALWVRPAEVLWLAALVLVVYVMRRRDYNWRQIVVFLLTGALSVLVLFVINWQIYDSIFRVGYNNLQSSSSSIALLWQQIFLPFGFNWAHFFFQVKEFLIKPEWFLLLPAIFAGIIYWRKKDLLARQWISVATIVSLILLFYYGSYWPWGESGQPLEPTLNIGAPHFRYWLMIFILSLPLSAIFFRDQISSLFSSKKMRSIVVIILLAVYSLISIQTVFLDAMEGLIKVKADIVDFQPRLISLGQIVEANAVLVIPDWADRIFFPEYAVIISIDDNRVHAGDVMASLKKIAEQRPLYYYSASSETDIASLQTEFVKYDLHLDFLQSIYKGEKLYRFEQI